jgi:gamma-glutamyl-gamma-aminobutyrate hydrolase PuuD
MKAVAITQRVAIEPSHGERRDCLDQAWSRFLLACELCPVPTPNNEAAARALCARVEIGGILLTGGNDLVAYGGDAPERDQTECALLDFAEQHDIPVIGVCRGMQMIQHRFGVKLQPVEGHVTPRQRVHINGRLEEVNSYHNFAAFRTCPELQPWAFAEDGAIEGLRTADDRLVGIMWHPERMPAVAAADVALFRSIFGAS